MRFLLAAVMGLVLAAGLALPLITSEGAAAPGAKDRFGAKTLDVTLREWTLETNTDRIDAGPVSLRMRNEGGIAHDLMIVRTDKPADELPLGLEGVAPQLAGDVVFGELHRDHDHGVGKFDPEDHILPGNEKRGQVDLTPGAYVLICPLREHYENGQRAPLTVE